MGGGGPWCTHTYMYVIIHYNLCLSPWLELCSLSILCFPCKRIPHYSENLSALDDDGDQQLNKEKLVLLTSCQPVLTYLKNCDHILYQCIVDFLIPEVLHPIPGTLTQAIRNFAKSLETSLSATLHGYSSKFVKAKVCVPAWVNACVCVCAPCLHACMRVRVCMCPVCLCVWLISKWLWWVLC